MSSPTFLTFGPFRIDLANETLWQGPDRLTLKPKSFAVLRTLLEQPQQLVTKDELLDKHWGDVAVGDAVLKTCIGEIRQALGEQASTPHYIETVHRRGYRFLVTPTSSGPSPGSPAVRYLVGRETELEQLHQWWEQAKNGERQVIFVTGEPGIGKTSLVNHFLHQLEVSKEAWIGRGQCIEQYGAGEAYLPILEALQRMCRQPGGERLVGTLKDHAPTWLVQLPGLLNPEEMQSLLPSIIGATPVRVMRELAEAVEALTTKQPLVLCLEDLHWLDTSSLDWLTYIARRSDPARLLIVGTFRPTDLILNENPLKEVKHELQVHEQCRELGLECLTEEAVREFLEKRIAAHDETGRSLQTVAHVVHRRTEGNPLFMVNVVDYIMHHKLLVQGRQGWQLQDDVASTTFPAGLRQFINLRVEQLNPEDQQLLVMGSITGMEFTTATIAAVLEREMTDIDQRLHELVRQEQFIHTRESEQWPDGTQTTKYAFHHALYQETLYDQVPEIKRIELHGTIGERLEQGYGEQARTIAAELALHFERGQDADRGSLYHQQAGEDAFKRSAAYEAILHLTKALNLFNMLPALQQRPERELMLQNMLGIQYIQTTNFGAPEVGKAFDRAWELCRQLPDSPQLFSILFGLFRYFISRGNTKMALKVADQLYELSHHGKDPAHLLIAHTAKGGLEMYYGNLQTVYDHLQRGLTLSQKEDPRGLIIRFGEDTSTIARSFLIFTLWSMGFAEQALDVGRQNLSRARTIENPFMLATALLTLAIYYCIRGDIQSAIPIIDENIALSESHGLMQFLGEGLFLRGSTNAILNTHFEDRNVIEEGQTLLHRHGVPSINPFYHAIHALTALHCQKHHEGLEISQDNLSFINDTGLRWFESEFTRLQGEFILGLGTPDTERAAQEAESCFEQAIKIARKQKAKMFELRAIMSLSRLWQQQGKGKQARPKLKKIYDWFTEGFDTKDLQEAKTLLDSLS